MKSNWTEFSWKQQRENLERRILARESMRSIGESYGVSATRIWQVLVMLGIDAPFARRKRFMAQHDTPEKRWLNKMLGDRRELSRKEHLFLLKTIETPKYCPIFGVELNYTGRNGARTGQDNSPSLDRLHPNKGYTPGNVYIISLRANRIKSNGTADEHIRIANWIKTRML